jgi:quinol monooxygenase YgiN
VKQQEDVMLVYVVEVHVLADSVEEFKEAILENARNSLQESGVVRFDVLQMDDDPSRFLLIEVYRDADGPARHKETAHYLAWKQKAEAWMAEPRKGIRFHNLFPEDAAWG